MAKAPIKKLENSGVAKNEEQYQHQPVMTNALKIKLDHLKTIEALTPNQQKFLDMYKRGGYFLFCLGSPGTGKTYLSVAKSLEDVLSRDTPYKQMVIVRSIVPTREVGFLPGTLEDKQEIYELPYREICENLFNRRDAWDRLKEQGFARFLSTTAIRGISIDDSIVVVDETQNFTWGELTTILTRIGHRSKIIFCGDRFQTDLNKRNDVSGLAQFLDVCRTIPEYEEVVFTTEDIVRSSLVKSFLRACEAKNILPGN